MTEQTTIPLDSAAFAFVRDGSITHRAPNRWPTGEVYWLYETGQESTYVVINHPHYEADADDDGCVFDYPAYGALTVLTPEGERPATQDEQDDWHDWATEEVREGLRD